MFAAGLLHDIDIVLKAEHLICEISNVIERVYADNIHMIDAETKILGVSHADFGLYVSIGNAFSVILTNIISRHQ